MSVKFNVATAFNFTTDSYLIVFNTANPNNTNLVTPVAAATNTGFAGYSFAIAVGGTGGSVTAQAFSYYRPTNSSQLPQLYPIYTTPQQLILTLNSNGLGTQFEVIFDRVIAEFNVSATTAPTTSPAPSAGATPTPTPAPTAVPSGVLVTQYWTFNFFTIQGTIQQYEAAQSVVVVDSLGQGGATDATYQSQLLNVDTTFDYPFYTQAGTHPNTQDAIAGGEIANNPGGATASPAPTASASSSAAASPTASPTT